MGESSTHASDADVLVIDDSDLIRASVQRLLSRVGVSVAGLASGVGCSRTLSRGRVRVVLVDLDMPVMTGDQVISELRQNELLGHVKLVLMSGHDDRALHEIAASVGADAAIAKSEGPDALVAVVERMLAAADRAAVQRRG
jgi:CheY-like chemotaxis protein